VGCFLSVPSQGNLCLFYPVGFPRSLSMKYFIPCACPISSSRQAVVNKTSNEEGRKIVRPLAVVVTKNGPTTIFGGTHHHAVALSLCVYCLLCCKHIITVFNFTKFLLFDVNLLTIRHGTNFESTAPTSLAMGEYPCVHTQKFRNAYAVCHSVPSAVFLVIGPSRPPTPSCILQIDVFGKSSQYYIIISMMTSFMHMSQKLVFHLSKCICAIMRILYYRRVCILVFLHVFAFSMLLRCMLKFKRLACD